MNFSFQDEDVYGERMRVTQMHQIQIDNEAVVLKDITKVHKNESILSNTEFILSSYDCSLTEVSQKRNKQQ